MKMKSNSQKNEELVKKFNELLSFLDGVARTLQNRYLEEGIIHYLTNLGKIIREIARKEIVDVKSNQD